MKAALVQQAARATTGTQDWTDANISSDLKGLMVIASQAVANDTVSAQFRSLFGASDLTRSVHITFGSMADATAAPNGVDYISNTGSLMQTNASPAVTVKAAPSATLSNGVTMNYSAVNATQYLENMLLLSGSDIEYGVGTAAFATTDTTIAVTHNLTGTPDVVIIGCSVGATAFDFGTAANNIIGVWERGGTTSAGLGNVMVTTANPTSVFEMMTTDMGHCISAGSDQFTMSVTSVGATTLNVTRNVTGSANMRVIVIAIRGTTSAMVAKCGIFTTPTSTGNSSPITGMSVAPQVLFLFSTRLQSSGAIQSDDTAGGHGISIAVNNNGATQQMAAASTTQDNVATSVAKCQTSATKALQILDNTGAANVTATLQSWNSDGVTLNYSAVNAAGLKVGYLAFGMQVSGPTGGTLGGGFEQLSGNVG